MKKGGKKTKDKRQKTKDKKEKKGKRRNSNTKKRGFPREQKFKVGRK